jgi:phosphate-selective porin
LTRVALALILILAASAAGQDDPDVPLPPTSEAERIRLLERELERQQKEIDALKGERSPSDFDWGYDDGFFLKGRIAGASYSIRPRGFIQLDYRAFPYSSKNLQYQNVPPEDQFVVRRARLGFQGNFGDFEFFFEVDPTRTAPQLPIANFFLTWHAIDELQLRAGSFVVPFGLEDGSTDPRYTDFIERAMVVGSGTAVAPDFRIGGEVFGKLGGGFVNYFVSVTNNPPSNAVAVGDPLALARVEMDLRGFELGGSGYWCRIGGAGGTSYSGRTPGQFQFFAPVAIRGWEQAYGVDASYYAGPVWIVGEYVWAQQDRDRVGAAGASGTPLLTQGAGFTVGWLLWGPTTPGPHPFPFKEWDLLSIDLVKKRNARNVGLELVARVEWIDVSEARSSRVSGTPPATTPNAVNVKGNQCEAVEAGVNLDAIENVRIMFEYAHLRTGDASRSEKAHSREADELLLRAQLEF